MDHKPGGSNIDPMELTTKKFSVNYNDHMIFAQYNTDTTAPTMTGNRRKRFEV